MLKIKSAILAAAAFVTAFGIVANAQTPIADYQVQDSYGSSVGTIGPLSVVGTASDVGFTDGATVNGHIQSALNVSVGSLSGATCGGVQAHPQGFLANPSNHSVVLLADFNISATDPIASKVLDFKNRSADDGL